MTELRADRKLSAEEELAAKTQDMLDRYCPNIQGTCKEHCAHYQAGYVCNGYLIHSPRCRLWRS